MTVVATRPGRMKENTQTGLWIARGLVDDFLIRRDVRFGRTILDDFGVRAIDKLFIVGKLSGNVSQLSFWER